jgi:serine/threonine-protein kinase
MSEGDENSGEQRDPTQLICPKCHRELSEESPYCPVDHAITGGVHAVTIGAISRTPRARRHLLGVTIGDAYVINGYLGSGGFGAVYRAEQKALARDVAIKMLMVDREVEQSVIDRFKREARTAAALLDPNIVTLFDYGEANLGDGEEEDRVLYFVMELVHGPTLRQYLKARKERGAGLEGSLQFGLNILRGLSAAHQLGVVHRDLKPGNVLIDESKGRRYFARLFDFGIASLTGSGGHTTAMGAGGVVGTPKYMAPEQWRAQQTAPCTDIYAFGAILAEMLSGKPPVPKADLVEMATAHCRNPRPHIQVTPRGEAVPRSLTNFVKKCMAIDPRQRYGSAREALSVLEAIIESGERAPIPTVTHFPVPGAREVGDPSLSADVSLSQEPQPLESPTDSISGVTNLQRPLPANTHPPTPPPFNLATRPPVRLSAPVPASGPPPIVAAPAPEPVPERSRRGLLWALLALILVIGVVLVIGLSGPDPLDPMKGSGESVASVTPVSVPTDPPTTPATQAAPTDAPIVADATPSKDAGVRDARVPDARVPDARVPDAAPATAAPVAAKTEPRKPKVVKRPVRKVVKAPPTAAPTAPPSVAPATRPAAPATAVARRVGGYDVTPKVNPTSADLAKAQRNYERGVDAHKRGAPKSALRFLVKSLKAGLKGAPARDAAKRIKQIVDRATLEGQTF